MNRYRARVVLFLLLLLYPASAALPAGQYRTVEVENLRITIDTEWASEGGPGYLPVRLEIVNLGDDRTIEFTARITRFLRASTLSGFSGTSTTDLRQTFPLKRGDRVRRTIPIPVSAGETMTMQIREDERVLETFDPLGFQSGTPPELSAVLVVVDPQSPLGNVTGGWPSLLRERNITRGGYYIYSGVYAGAASGRAGSRAGAMDFVLEPGRLPTSWLGFTPLRGVFIGPAEWNVLSAPQKEALLTWTACGGDLMFLDGDAVTLFPDGASVTQTLAGSPGNTAPYFLGRIHFLKLADVAAKGINGVLSTHRADLALPANRSSDFGRIIDRGFRLPIPGIDGVPAKAYMYILVLFAMLMGPANYFYLWRKRQPALILLTVPVISGVFIVVLGIYVLAGEGFGVRGRAETWTILDQVTKQAATRASVSLYAAGMAPSGGLRFPRDLAVFPLGTDGTGNRGSERVDLTETQQFASGIIQARAPSNFEEIGFRVARERLSFSNDGGTVSLVNGLGVKVDRLRYLNGGKAYRLSQPLAAGEKAVLVPADASEADVSRTFLSGLNPSPEFPRKYQLAMDSQPDGSYIALLERSPFWEPGVPKLDERGSTHLLLGYVGEEP